MGILHRRQTTLAGINVDALSRDELRKLVQDILEEKMHGVSYSPYVEGQGPGTQIGEAQIRERLAFIQDYTKSIRTFSCSEGNELIPPIAKEAAIEPWRNSIMAGLPPRTQPRLSSGITARYQTPQTGIVTMGMSRCAARWISARRASRSNVMVFATRHATSPASVVETTVRKHRLGQKLGLKKPSKTLPVSTHFPGVSCHEMMPLMRNKLAQAAAE